MLDYLSRREVFHEAFFKKYASRKFMKASIMVREWVRSPYGIETIKKLLDDNKKDGEDQVDNHDEDVENTPVEDDNEQSEDTAGSDVDDYLYANELEQHEVGDEGEWENC
jgi:hypothetical protein